MKVTAHPGGVVISVKVVPNSSRDALAGMLGDALKIKVAKPPEAGAANKAVETLLARTLGVAGNRVSIVAGHGQPHKQVLIAGVTVEAVREAIGRGIKK